MSSTSDVLLKNRRTIISTIETDGVLIESLYINNILSERQYQSVKSERTQLGGAEKLFDIVKCCGLNGFVQFCEALKEDHHWLSEILIQDAQEIGLNCDLSKGKNENYISLPAHIYEAIPSERQLMKLSKVLVRSDWQSVMYELGLHTCNIDQCKQSNAVEYMQCMSGLVLWLRKAGQTATFKLLLESMENANVEHHCLSDFVKIACNS